MNRRYGILDRAAALAASLALFSAGCGGHGGADEADPDPGPTEGPNALDGAPSPNSVVDVAAEVEQRRAQANPLAASAEVGTIPGTASVDSMGSAHYTIPVDVAPGAGGMTPEISISYDSNRDAGLVGLGFAIDGFGSTIERCTKTIADHGAVGPIQFELDDGLCFGGRPLVLVNGTYGQPGSEYRTRRDPFDKVVLLGGDIQSDASQWEAWLSDGRVIEFAVGAETHAAGEAPLKWYAERIRDRYDNALEYGWGFTPTSARPGSIVYGDGREVRFEYLDLRTEGGHSDAEVRSGYVAGRYYEKPYLLERIRVYGGGGAHLWDYNFTYDLVNATQQNALESVQRCDAAGACLPATWFSWDQVWDGVGDVPFSAGTQAPDIPPPTNTAPTDPFVLATLAPEFVNSGWDEPSGGDSHAAALVSGAFQVMDIDGNGTDEVLVLDFDTGHFVLDPGSEIDDVEIPSGVFADLLDTVAFPDPSDTTLNSPSPVSVGLEDRSEIENYALDLLKCEYTAWQSPGDGDCDPTLWSYSSRALLHALVESDAEPDDDDSLSTSTVLSSVPDDAFTPGLSPLPMNLFGGSKGALLFPIAPEALGEAGSPRYTTWFVAAHDGTYDPGGSVEFANYSFDPGGRVHSAIPVDHDGNGLSDLWMCRGDDPKQSTWTLALNRGDDPPAWFVPGYGETSAVPENGGTLAFETFDSGVRCSSWDETLVVDMDGTSRSSLLVSPAFDPNSTSNTVLSDASRSHYLQLDFDPVQGPGSYQVSSLPRDRFQRWHDRTCRNGPGALGGSPVFGAGPGLDRQVDVNGDGLTDILRFELVSGDGNPNLGNIQDGLIGSWRHQDSCSESATHQDSVIRVYLNRGDGVFEPQSTPLFTFDGNPHAQFWLKWMNGWAVEINTDGLLDFALPIDDGELENGELTAGALFEVWVSRPNGTYVQGASADAETWPNYTSDTAFRAQLARLGSMSKYAGDRPGEIHVLGDMLPGNEGFIPREQDLMRKGRPLRLAAVSNGMGKWDSFEYAAEARPDPDAVATLPGAKLTSAQAVVTQHRWQTGPQSAELGDYSQVQTFSYSDPRIDLHTGQLLGFGQVTRAGSGVHIREGYTFAYDDAVRGFPLRGVPRVVERTIDLSPDAAPGTEQIVECAYIPGGAWETRTPDGGATWFSYPTRRESFLLTENFEPCEDASASGWYDALTVYEESQNNFGGVTWSEESRDGFTTTTTRTQPVNDAAEWFVGRFGREQVTGCAGVACETRSQTLVYDTTHAELDSSTIEPGTPQLELTTDFIRDDGPGGHGGVVTRTRTDASGAIRVERFGWDDHGVHLEWQSNPLNHRTYFVHDNPTGARIAVVEPNGISVETEYDGFLRPVTERKRETPMGAFAGAWTETEYQAPGASDVFAARTVTSAKPDATGQVVVEEVGPTGKALRSQWEGVVPLSVAFAPPGSTILSHNQVEVFYEYDARGRLFRESNPTWLGTPPDAWTQWSYDNLDRPLESTLLDGSFDQLHQEERWEYDYGALGTGRVVLETYTDQDGKSTRRYFDGAQRVIEAYDGMGTPTAFVYGPFDVLAEVRRGGLFQHDALSITTYGYDRLGRRVAETAPESGTSTVGYTPFGEVEVVTLPEGTTAFVHDDLGRVTDRIDADGFHTWTYDTQRIGALSGSASADGIGRGFTYDAWGRTATETTTGPQGAFTLEFEYDPSDRLEKVTYPDPGYSVFHEYDAFGYHRRSRSQRAPCAMSDAVTDWEWVTGDPAGNVKEERFGNGISTTRDYQQGTYRPTSIQILATTGSPLQSLTYDWTDAGDLNFRDDTTAGQTETFTYDDAHRLRTWGWGGATSETRYDPLGNIVNKSGAGSYTYDPATDRLTQVGAHSYTYDDNGNVLSDGERTLTWTAQNMVRSLQRDGKAWSLLYDADGTRVVREDAASNSATYNVGSTYELRFDGAELSEARISVLGATGRVVAEVFAERTALEGNGLWENRKKFVHDDHLGSAHMISDRDGAVETRVMYSPWGAARDGSNWYLPLSEGDLDTLPAGFTGHQPELDTGLINMRGRMYDPVIGRFMSVDPVIENALEVGTWNAYSYVLNRPLSLVDPTGLAAGTQTDIQRHDSFLAEQGFVGSDYHDVEAYRLQLEFWKPYKAQTHGPRIEEETKKPDEGKPVEAVVIEQKVAGDNASHRTTKTARHEGCREWQGRTCILGETAKGVAERSKGGKGAIVITAVLTVGILYLSLVPTLGDDVALSVVLDPKCFAAGTQVVTPDGATEIEKIVEGDLVWSQSGVTGESGWRRVEEVHRSTAKETFILEVRLPTGGSDTIELTPEHPIYALADPGWKSAKELLEGEKIATRDGFATVVNFTHARTEVPVYNLEIEEFRTFFAGHSALWVHNGGPACLLQNQLPELLELELSVAAEVGAVPIEAGTAEFMAAANQGTLKWVVTQSGKLFVTPHTVGGVEISHAVLSGGESVLAAGHAEIAAAGGEAMGLSINALSGHFGAGSVDIGIAAFEAAGVLF